MIYVDENTMQYTHKISLGCRIWDYNNDKRKLSRFISDNRLVCIMRKHGTLNYAIIDSASRAIAIRRGAEYGCFADWMNLADKMRQLELF